MSFLKNQNRFSKEVFSNVLISYIFRVLLFNIWINVSDNLFAFKIHFSWMIWNNISLFKFCIEYIQFSNKQHESWKAVAGGGSHL